VSKRIQKVSYTLDSIGVKHLIPIEIKAILRAADELINCGGRSMLAKILKGSKDKKLLEHGLENCPSFGFYNTFSLPEITKRIDWMIVNDYLVIEYSGRLPLLVFSHKGWEIERETLLEELFTKLRQLSAGSDFGFVQELKDMNRVVIMNLIEKIKETNDPVFIPILQAWQLTDYKKVVAELQIAVDHLMRFKE